MCAAPPRGSSSAILVIAATPKNGLIGEGKVIMSFAKVQTEDQIIKTFAKNSSSFPYDRWRSCSLHPSWGRRTVLSCDPVQEQGWLGREPHHAIDGSKGSG